MSDPAAKMSTDARQRAHAAQGGSMIRRIVIAVLASLLPLSMAGATIQYGCPLSIFSTYDGKTIAEFSWVKDANWPYVVSGVIRVGTEGSSAPIQPYTFRGTFTKCNQGGDFENQPALGVFGCGGFLYVPNNDGSNIAFQQDHYWNPDGSYGGPGVSCTDNVGGPSNHWTYPYSWGLQMKQVSSTSMTVANDVTFYYGPQAVQIAQNSFGEAACLRSLTFDVVMPDQDNGGVMTPVLNPAGSWGLVPSGCALSSWSCTMVTPAWPYPRYLNCHLVFGNVVSGGGSNCPPICQQ